MTNDQDMRVVEGMARTGIDFDGLFGAFPRIPIEEIERIYMQFRKIGYYGNNGDSQDIKCCGSERKY